MTPRLPLLGAILSLCLLLTPALTRGSGPATLNDDLTADSLMVTISRSLDYLRRQPPERSIRLCNNIYDNGWLVESLEEFAALLTRHGNTSPAFTEEVRQRFTICGGDAGNLMVTGYYEPEVAGSLTASEIYRYPLYRTPPDLITRGGEIGRLDNGRLVPYWSRQELEEQNKLQGLELVYLADPMDNFTLQVQGSGRIRLPDNTIRRVHFAAKNGRPYRSIGRFLVDEGRLRLSEVNMPAIRAYIAAHPQEAIRILQHNESFIFFNWAEYNGDGPAGYIGQPLTAGRSVALDQQCYPAGALGYLLTRKPQVDGSGQITGWLPMGRFVLNQDSGSAIKGPNRLDLFWGGDREAEIAAGNMKQAGKLYFLIKKQRRADNQQRGQL